MLCRHCRGLSFVLSVMYMMLYNSLNLTLNKFFIRRIPDIYEQSSPFFYEHLQISFKKGTAPNSTILFPVYRLNINKQKFDPLPFHLVQ